MLTDRRPRLSSIPLVADAAPGDTAHDRGEAPSCTDDAALVVIDGERMGRRIPIGTTPLILGRGVGADFRIADPTVSRHHCIVWRAGGRCWVRDLESTNRTRVNERVAAMAELCDGDVLIVGHTAMTLAVGAAPAAERERDDTPPC